MCAKDSIIDVEAPPTMEKKGFYLRWSRLSKTVQVKEANSGLLRGSIAAPTKSSKESLATKTGPVLKIILDEVSGSAAPGEVVGLMGPSGSGKTSLLNVLSCRSKYDSGVISINGEPLTSHARKKLMSKIAYVKQSDVFFGHLTVRDQLTYTALLRLPSSIPREKKVEEVDKIISLLRLGRVANSPIMLTSGGEKKRVNIGTELLTDPKVLLLDEPTSGLDSTSAVALVDLLQKLCRSENKTVITSIHQPTSAVFRSFDKLLMLAEGNVVYFGTPVGSLTYLSDLNLKTPDGYNAADHWMDLLVRDTLVDETEGVRRDVDAETTKSEDNGTSRSSLYLHRRKSSLEDGNKPRGILIDSWDNEGIAEQIDGEVEQLSEAEASVDHHLLDDMRKYNTSWITQFRILMHRSMKNSRSAIFTTLNMIKSVALGLVAGLLWFQIEVTEKSVRDISSFFFFSVTYWVFDSMFNALLAFPSERTIILKERASASYRLSAYFLAKTTAEAPTRFILPLLYMVIAYWMLGVNDRFSIFLGTTGFTLLSVLAGEAIGLVIGASIYDMERAITTMTVIALALMLLGGFYLDTVPSFISWVRFLSPFKYAYNGSVQMVFDNDVPCDGSGVLEGICVGSGGSATPDQIFEYLKVEGSVGFNAGMLFVLSIIPRFFAYLALRSKKSGDRE
jgi:ABC-type multidrug transport system ATPase subunit/ABC-type multidrug transport system permease subunit